MGGFTASESIDVSESTDAPGVPLRLRLERQLGQMAKFVRRIQVVERFDRIVRGRGGTWEDDGCEWDAGI
jgi:hypothetical protein